MILTVRKINLKTLKDDLVIVPFFQNNKKIAVNKSTQFLNNALKKVKDRFTADFKSTLLYNNYLFLGLGEKKDLSSIKLLQAIEAAVKFLKANKVSQYSLFLSSIELSSGYGRIITRAVGNVLYSFDQFKTGKKHKSSQVILGVSSSEEEKNIKKEVAEALKINEATDFLRDLGNYPPNELTATRLAEFAKEMAKKIKIDCTIWGKKELEKRQFGALLAVNKGSFQEPAFIILEYNKNQKNVSTLCLVGKGITFDTGGINLKPSSKLEEMKFDMCGAALMLAVTQVVASLKLPIHLVTLIPTTDNMPGGSATVPSAVVKSHSGKTIEILNTDAEGRLILGDALSYAEKFKPHAIIDAATLTGACSVALGPWFAGVMSNNKDLAKKLKKASDSTGERLWQLPLCHDHDEAIKSKIADIQNVSSVPGGGASTAGKFLEFFVPKNTPWAHLDIAGTAWSNNLATGFGVALLTEVIEHWNK